MPFSMTVAICTIKPCNQLLWEPFQALILYSIRADKLAETSTDAKFDATHVIGSLYSAKKQDKSQKS